MLYLQTLLLRDDEEVTKRVLRQQQQNPSPGDFSLLIKDDFRKMDMMYDENNIISVGIGFKKLIKDAIRITSFDELLEMQKTHSKILAIKRCSLFVSLLLMYLQGQKTYRSPFRNLE